ncbi:50S ribosomal protein L29 (plastid) [Chondrus crispus]|uniref:Large ribosomal subunit protein uL29c n=1 Tax=Chondrus crispus TaxID=2769 RepID=M5DBR9_CHOCR|nr:50S ribosomal protein L29 [Chondrus crispus]CCP38127.1 50S ribosomal protein L29 [Chondrus crispus]|eukprot:YP_007627380.1 50S ribosomal protein L29 (plastid) [Chondrus crispus]
MAFTKINNIQDLTNEKIEARIIEIKKDLLQLKIKKATRQSFKPHIFKHKRHELAQLLTIETKRINK